MRCIVHRKWLNPVLRSAWNFGPQRISEVKIDTRPCPLHFGGLRHSYTCSGVCYGHQSCMLPSSYAWGGAQDMKSRSGLRVDIEVRLLANHYRRTNMPVKAHLRYFPGRLPGS